MFEQVRRVARGSILLHSILWCTISGWRMESTPGYSMQGQRLEAATIAVLVDFCYPTSPVDFCYPTAYFPTSSTTSIFFVGSYFSTSSTKSIFFGGRAGSAPDTGESHVQNKYLHDVVNNNAAETRRALSKDGSEWCMCHHPGPRAFWLGGGCQGGRLSEGRRAWVRR